MRNPTIYDIIEPKITKKVINFIVCVWKGRKMPYCINCGNELPDNAKFCQVCGNSIGAVSARKTIQLRCKNCNGVMTIDNEKEILSCPFCGSKEVIDDSDEVTIERIRSNAYKEVEFRKMERENEREKRQEEKAKFEASQKSRLGKVSIVFAIICGIVAVISFNSHFVIRGFIAIIQTLLFVGSLLVRKQIINAEREHMSDILAVIGLLLFIPYFLLL